MFAPPPYYAFSIETLPPEPHRKESTSAAANAFEQEEPRLRIYSESPPESSRKSSAHSYSYSHRESVNGQIPVSCCEKTHLFFRCLFSKGPTMENYRRSLTIMQGDLSEVFIDARSSNTSYH
ncbi:MAG: hypothetical protein ACOYK9_04230 [Chlamydiia bacterium]